jgi:hypothetical protein
LSRQAKSRLLRRAKDWHPAVAIAGHATAIIAVIASACWFTITVIVNYPNRSRSNEVVAEPFGQLFSLDVYQFLLDYRWPIIFICLAVFGAALLDVYLTMRRHLISMQFIDDVAREYNAFLEKLRAFTLEAMDDGRMHSEAYDQYLHRTRADTNQFFQAALNRICVLYTEYTNNQCHVSVKLFNPDTEKVRTVFRDDLSTSNRDSVDENLKWYEYRANTAFIQILDNNSKDSFLCNHLWLATLCGKYKNGNPRWTKFYSASIVAPITMKTHSAEINKESVLGFLCVDNRHGGFDSRSSIQILRSFARMFYFSFVSMAKILWEE